MDTNPQAAGPATEPPPAQAVKKKSGNRLAFIDWTRGFAALIMLQGHVFHSFTRGDLRNQDAYILSQFVGGMPPAIFLFLTGLTLAFLMDSNERKGLGGWQKLTSALRRAAYLGLLAILFRVQMWIFGWPQSDWLPLLRVDILNCMGFGMAVLSLMALFTTAERVRMCSVLGLAIAAASPLMSQLDTAAVPAFIRAYFVPSYEHFSFFPWGAFLAFGMGAGSILRLAPAKEHSQVMQWSGWMGLAIVFGAHYFSNLPYSLYAKSDFWLDGPALILIKLGVILMLMAFAFAWNGYVAPGWSWVAQLGTTSLLVYWVHTELVYGRWLSPMKESLSIGQTIAAAIGVILLMLGLSIVRTRWAEIRAWWTQYRSPSEPVPEAE